MPQENQDLNVIVDEVCERVKPMITEIVMNTIADSNAAQSSSTEEVKPVAVELPEISEIAVNVKDILAKVKVIEPLVQDFTYKDEIITRLHDELQKYKNGLRKEFITPLLKGIMREYDRAVRQYNHYAQWEQCAEQGKHYDNLLKQFQMLGYALLDMLNDYDVEAFDAKEGDAYSSKIHKILEVVETTEPEKENTIAEVLACGFRDISNDRLMRHVEVKIYKLKA
jgi:molecular chaperone GrpE (heat shock protein)